MCKAKTSKTAKRRSFPISTGISHTVAAFSDRPTRVLAVAAPIGFAHLIAATGMLNEAATLDMALIERIAAEIGDEILNLPRALPSAYSLAT